MSIELGREDGIYLRLGERAYFANDRLSSSGAKLALFDPPRFEHEIINGNAPPPKPAYATGTAVHVATLEPEQFEHRYAVADCKTKTAKAYKDLAAKEPLRTVITTPELDVIRGAAESVRNAPLVRDCNGIDLLSGESEVTIYTRWEGTPIKARLDKWLPKHSAIMDLKTCASAAPDAVRRDIWTYRYPLSMGWYLTAGLLHTGQLPKHWFWVFVETKAPYTVAVYEASEKTKQIGCRQAEQALAAYQARSQSGDWTYSREAIPIDPPAWVVDTLTATAQETANANR